MPIYEYQCQKCGQVTEQIQKMSDPPLKKCPSCGGKVGKLMSMNTFHLKGSGWYVTDYSRKNSPSDTGHSSSKKAEKSEKADAKPEAKAKAKASSTE